MSFWTRGRMQAAAAATAALPGLGLVAQGLTAGLGADPVETITHTTGEWALRWLLVCLAVTPARRWLGWSWAAPLRRTFGVAAYAYACLHVGTWAVLDWGLDLGAMWEDVLERRYIAAGFTAFALMTPLAATSTRSAMRRLGRCWIPLHRLVYAAAIAAVLHFLWLVKADLAAPLVHGAILALLLAARWMRPARAGGGS